ncbi:hypothetical protein [Hyalangium minutum]|uniref:Uncharacterized protein n=1 Tax=Hyalangium minutum TaxID=394096 RepID=A0A085WIG5_9BACT|nr:hypothetical protein [Hyalangium minutum]KFE67478.1 hypothetical protein DB31_8831 [Hyalangium minutum]
MPHVFHSPLTTLMGATSGCAPGCGCDDDIPVPDPHQVAAWVQEAGEAKARKALGQLQRVIERKQLQNMKDIQRQVGRTFAGPVQLEAWLREWEQALLAALEPPKEEPR